MAIKNEAVVFLMFVILAVADAATKLDVPPQNVTCHDVVNYFAYCQEFVNGNEDEPTPKCCDNLHIINEKVRQEERGARRYCYCIEVFCATASQPHPPYVASRIAQLDIKCHIHRSFPISERMKYSKYVIQR